MGPGTQQTIVRTPTRKPPTGDREPLLGCPRCADRMQRRRFARRCPVVIDECNEHGVWFDADELREAYTWVSHVRPPTPGTPVQQKRGSDSDWWSSVDWGEAVVGILDVFF
jgi:hypothetical protein